MVEIFDENSIPGLDLDVETIDSNAATLKTKAGDLRSAGSSIKTTWSGMSACYKAPEQEQLYAAMNPVEKNSDDLADDLEKIAGYVNTFADTARQIKTDAQTLKKDGQAFKKKIAAKPDWQTKQELVDENTRLVNRASSLKIRLWDAERTCANNIRALDCLAPYHANPNSDNDKLWYGYSQIPADADKPWGKSVERQDKCPKKAAVSVKRFVWDGLVVDGLGGSINGLANLVGLDFSGNGDIWSLERLSNTWSAVTGLIGHDTDENGNSTWSWGKAGSTWKEVGLAALHVEEWGTDPARALGATTFDVVSLVIPVVGAASKAGKFGKAGSTLSKVGKAAEVAAKVLDVIDPVGAVLAKPIGKVSNIVISRLLPDFDIIETIGKWTGANVDVNVGSGSHRGFDMNNPDASILEPDVSSGKSKINAGDSSVADASSKPYGSDGGISTNDLGRPHAGSAHTSPTDVGNAADMPGQSQSRGGVTDASRADTDESPRAMNDGARGSENASDRAGADVDGHESRQTTAMHGLDKSHSEPLAGGRKANDGGRELAGRDGDATEVRGGSRHADGDTGRADADGRRESAKDGAEPAGGADRDRAGRGADADAGRDRADSDASAGHERGGDADGRRADADGHRDQAKNDADADNKADQDRTDRNSDSDGERDRGMTDSDAPGSRDRARHADGDTGRADADGRRESAKDGAEPAGGADRDRAGRGADADASRDRADRDASAGHERVRDTDAANSADRDRTRHDADPHGERSRGKADTDATEGRNRAHQGDGDGTHADTDEHLEHGKKDTETANGARHDGTDRHGDSDVDSGRDKTDGDDASNSDVSDEDPDKKPLTVEERQEWIDQVEKGRDQDPFNQKHRTAGPEVDSRHRLNLKINEQFGVGQKLDPNAHYEVTRTTSKGVSYKSHYYTDSNGEVRHVETGSKAMTGHLNPDLRNPLPNVTYTVDGRFHYTTDAWSRTVRLEVDMLGDVVERFRSRSDTVQGHVKDYGNELASKYDTKFNGGHIVGARSGGPSEEINTVTMLEEVNQYRVDSKLKSFKPFEEKIAADPENFRNLVIEFKFPEPAGPKIMDAERVPTSFEAKWIDRTGVPQQAEFSNQLESMKE